MITSIGIYPDLFDLYLPDLQERFGVFDTKAIFPEAGLVGTTSVQLRDSVIYIDRRDGKYHTKFGEMSDWHQEGTFDELYPTVMVWSNIYPTELQLPDGEVIIPESNELVMFDNRQIKHRTPDIPIDQRIDRYFITARFTGLVPTVRQLNRFRKILSSKD